MISINEFISTTFLSGLLDDLLQLGQVRLRKLSVGGLQQRSHRLRDRPLKKSGNDDNESARADSDAEVRAISRADLRSKRRNNTALVNTQLPTDTSRSSPIFLASAAKTPKSPSVVAPVAKFIDWSVIQVLTMRTPRENG